MKGKLTPNIPSTILVLKLDHLGDMLWATPSFAALKFKYPQAKIQVVCPASLEPVLRHNPTVDQTLIYDKTRFSSSAQKQNWLRQNAGKPDWAICLDTRDEAVLLAYLSQAPVRIGYFYKDRPFSTIKSWWRLTHKFVHPTMHKNPRHEVLNNLRLLERTGMLSLTELPAELLSTRLYLTSAEMQQAKQVFESLGLTNQPVIMYNIPNKTINKGWPKEHIVQVTRQLSEKLPDARILMVAGPGEETLLESIQHALPSACRTITGLPLRVWAGLFSYCRLSLSRDAGGVHVSAAMGVPAISIFEYEWKHLEACFEPWQIPHTNLIRPQSASPANIERHVADVVSATIDLWKKVSNAH